MIKKVSGELGPIEMEITDPLVKDLEQKVERRVDGRLHARGGSVLYNTVVTVLELVNRDHRAEILVFNGTSIPIQPGDEQMDVLRLYMIFRQYAQWRRGPIEDIELQVREAKLKEAEVINKQGLAAQIKYLMLYSGVDDIEEIVKKMQEVQQ